MTPHSPLKILPLVIAVTLLASLLSVSAQNSMTPQQMLLAAQEAEKSGNFVQANAYYRDLVRQYPQNPRIRAALARTTLAIREGTTGNTLETQLKQIIVPSVEFAQTDLDTALNYLRQLAKELSGGKVVPNIIYKGTEEERKSVTVTLRLASVPFTDVIRYVGELSNTRFKYEKHAIVGTPVRMLQPSFSTTETGDSDSGTGSASELFE